MKVVVVGQGYVGLPVAMRAVEVGHTVVGLEASADRARRLAAGVSGVEGNYHGVLGAALESGLYTVSTEARDCGGFDVAVITVPTPLSEGLPDLSYIED